MKYARVIDRVKSAEDLDEFYGKWDIWFPDNMPLAQSDNGSNRFKFNLMMAVYDNEEIAEEAKQLFVNFLT